jgi:putative ABC transport system substrate-binding protein
MTVPAVFTRWFFRELLRKLPLNWWVLALSCGLSACSVTPEVVKLSQVSDVEDRVRTVLVLNSNQSVERYQIAERYFIGSQKNREIVIMDLQGKHKPVEYIQDKLNAQRFDLVYAIGAKALGSVNLIDPDVPVVYSAVLNWRRFRQQENYFGISSELSPQVQLTWFKYFFPEINSIGVLYSQENANMIEEAEAVARNLGINLVSAEIRSQAHLKESASQLLKQVDVMWLVSDSRVLSSVDKVKQLFSMAHLQRIPVLTYNPVFVEMGATMSLAADLPTIGRQAALMADEILERKLPEDSIQFPVGSRIMLNSQKIREYGLQLNAGALDSVDEIYP